MKTKISGYKGISLFMLIVVILTSLTWGCTAKVVEEVVEVETVVVEASAEESIEATLEPTHQIEDLPDSISILIPDYAEDWINLLLEQTSGWLESVRTEISTSRVTRSEIDERVESGDLADLVVLPDYMYGQLASQGYKPILTLTGSGLDTWRPIIIVRSDSGLTSLGDLAGLTIAGFVESWEFLSALYAEDLTAYDFLGIPSGEDWAIDLLLSGEADVAVIGNYGLTSFYSRDLSTLMSLTALGYGIPIPNVYRVYASSALSEEEKTALEYELIDGDFSETYEIGYGWVDEEEMEQLNSIRDAVNEIRVNGASVDELVELLNLDADWDEDGVADIFDECPDVAENAENDNTFTTLGRDGCPCVWGSEDPYQILHLLEPAIIPLDEELQQLASVAEEYGLLEQAELLRQAADAAGESDPSDLITIFESFPNDTVSQEGSPGLSYEIGNSRVEREIKKAIQSWINDKTAAAKKSVKAFSDRWSTYSDIKDGVNFAMKKTGGLIGIDIERWTALTSNKLMKFPRVMKATKGFNKAMGVVGSMFYIHENSEKIFTSFYEAISLVKSDPNRDLMLSFYERLVYNYGTKNFVGKAVIDLFPVKTFTKVVRTLVEYLPKWDPDPGIKFLYTPDQIKNLEEAMRFQDKNNYPKHLITIERNFETYVGYRQNTEMRLPGDFDVNTTTGDVIYY
jgi:hypothetical protein